MARTTLEELAVSDIKRADFLGNFKYLDDMDDLAVALGFLFKAEELILEHTKHFTEEDLNKLITDFAGSPYKAKAVAFMVDKILKT